MLYVGQPCIGPIGASSLVLFRFYALFVSSEVMVVANVYSSTFLQPSIYVSDFSLLVLNIECAWLNCNLLIRKIRNH